MHAVHALVRAWHMPADVCGNDMLLHFLQVALPELQRYSGHMHSCRISSLLLGACSCGRCVVGWA